MVHLQNTLLPYILVLNLMVNQQLESFDFSVYILSITQVEFLLYSKLQLHLLYKRRILLMLNSLGVLVNIHLILNFSLYLIQIVDPRPAERLNLELAHLLLAFQLKRLQ